MGAAAYARGNALIRRHLDAEARPVEFQLMEDLNAAPKYESAGTPFSDIDLVAGHGGWWAMCPTTGFGYWYRSLREAVQSWRVEIYSYEEGIWSARPLPHSSIEPAPGHRHSTTPAGQHR